MDVVLIALECFLKLIYFSAYHCSAVSLLCLLLLRCIIALLYYSHFIHFRMKIVSLLLSFFCKASWFWSHFPTSLTCPVISIKKIIKCTRGKKIIIFCFENVAFFQAKLGLEVFPRVDNHTSGDILLDLTRPLSGKIVVSQLSTMGIGASFGGGVRFHTNQLGLGKRHWNLETSSAVVEFLPPTLYLGKKILVNWETKKIPINWQVCCRLGV